MPRNRIYLFQKEDSGICTCWYHPEGRDDTMIQEAGVQVDEVITDLHEVYGVLEKL